MAWTYPDPSVHFSTKFEQVHAGRLIRRRAGYGNLIHSRKFRAEEASNAGEPFEEKMPRLVAEFNAQFADLSACDALAESAKLEQAIKANLKGLGYGG